jgi:hypothetical protein
MLQYTTKNTWKYRNMNPTVPNVHDTIKLNKTNISIRPTINWENAAAYDLAKHLTKMLHNHMCLPYTYNVHNNSNRIMTDLQTIKLNRDMRICSFDTEHMYTNIPKRDNTNIINNILEKLPRN